MNKGVGSAALGIMLAALVAAAMPNRSVGDRGKAEPPDLWRVLKGYELSSAAWSPSGDRIAFISTSDRDRDDGDDLLRAHIWLVSLSNQGQVVKLRRLATLTRGQGIPVALFWLDDNRIGWAAARYSGRTHLFNFMNMSLNDSKSKRLVSRSFTSFQNRQDMESAFGGPDDVYYDTDSHTLLFSGGVMPRGAYVKILSVSTGQARKLFVPQEEGGGWVTLCGSLHGPHKPVFYIAAFDTKPGGWRIWRSDSYSLHQDKVLVTFPVDEYGLLNFPRASSNGKLLACLTHLQGSEHWEIMLHDLESGKNATVATLYSDWEEIQPAMGCPFSWSPDGTRIAYADGSKINIVRVSGDAR